MNEQKIIIAILGAVVVVITLMIGIFVYQDAKKKQMNAVMWTAIALLCPVLIGFVLRILVAITHSMVLYNIRYALYIISLLIFAVTVFRSLSKNLARRARENEVFMRWWGNWQPYFHKQAEKAKPKMRMMVRKMQDSDHVYKKCPDCKAVLRLAKKRGKHQTRCPACGKRFQVHIWFGDK